MLSCILNWVRLRVSHRWLDFASTIAFSLMWGRLFCKVSRLTFTFTENNLQPLFLLVVILVIYRESFVSDSFSLVGSTSCPPPMARLHVHHLLDFNAWTICCYFDTG